MGALLAKPIASSFRVWDLTQFKTVDYLNNLQVVPINVFLFASKPVRILPVDTWISDQVRFSFDGWSRQRLTSCYIAGIRSSWYRSLAYFTNLILLKRVSMHWSSIESNLIVPFITVLNKLCSISLPYSNVSSFCADVESDTYRWNISERYPTYESLVKPILYKSESTITVFRKVVPILTSTQETEMAPLKGSFTEQIPDITCFVQTENLTSNNFIYIGTHGYINAQTSLLSLPILMAYERTNSITGTSFVRGPLNSRSLVNLSFVLMQLYSDKVALKVKKPYPYLSTDLSLKISSSRHKFLSFFRQPPQYEVSPLVQILTDFIRYE